MALELAVTLRGHEGPVWSIAWSKSGLLASCGVDRSVRVWQQDSDSEKWSLVTTASDVFRRTVRSLEWGTDGRSLAVACFDGITSILELTGGPKPKLEAAVSLEGHESEVKGVAYSGSGGLLATCSRDRSVWIWEVGLDFEYECISVLNGHSADVKAVAWHPKLELLVSCSYDGVAKVWVEDEDDWFCSETLAAHNATVWCAAFDPAGERLATCSSDSSVILWRRNSPHPSLIGAQPSFKVSARLADVHDGPVYSCAFRHDGKLMATGGGDDCINIISRTDKPRVSVDENSDASSSDEDLSIVAKMNRAHSGDVNCVSWKPDSKEILATCGDDGLVRIWRFTEGKTELAPSIKPGHM